MPLTRPKNVLTTNLSGTIPTGTAPDKLVVGIVPDKFAVKTFFGLVNPISYPKNTISKPKSS